MRPHLTDIVFVIAIVIALLFVSGPRPQPQESNFCSSDADCAPAQCCHPTSAISKNFAPDCAGIICTAECVPGTLDCGQGEIKCVANKCTVILKQGEEFR